MLIVRAAVRAGKGRAMANRKKPLVVVTRKLPDSIETRMRELFDAKLKLDDKPMSQAELADTVKGADVLVPTVTDRIDSSVLSKAGERLKLIANYGNGVDHIDVATALSRGITVTNTPGVLTEDTALISAYGRSLDDKGKVIDASLAEAAKLTKARGYRYFVVRDEIVIVEPGTMKIVAVLAV